jgi:TolA-binding protein
MKRTIVNVVFSVFFLSFFLAACTTTGVKQPEEKAVPAKAPPTAYTKEQKETLDIFTQILDIYENAESRQAAAKDAEVLYARIINEYPGTPLAQESYWKLITVAVRDYRPPDFEKAEVYYREFKVKYPDSVLKNAVDQTLINSYVRHKEWARLQEFCTPAVMQYKEQGNKISPLVLFMYAEANYRLDSIREAEEAYEIVLKMYPSISFGKRAKKRLKEIRQTAD